MTELATLSAVQAISAAAENMPPVGKDDTNSQQGFKYRGIERILAAAAPSLQKFGVVVVPRVIDQQWSTMERGKDRTLWNHLTLTVEYRFYGPAGDHLEAVTIGEGLDNADKAASKAQTMAFKAALLQVLAIADDADDGDATTAPEAKATRTRSSSQGTRTEAGGVGDSPTASRRERTLAQQLHIEAGRLLRRDDEKPEVGAARFDAITLAVTGGRTTSAKDVSDEEGGKIRQRMRDFDARKLAIDVADDLTRVTIGWSANDQAHELVFVRGEGGQLAPLPKLEVVS